MVSDMSSSSMPSRAKVSLRQMKKASFIANLDVHKVSVDPKDPRLACRSATSQAVKRLMGPEMQRRRMTGLVGSLKAH
eukprot:5788287-Amphidinium_carterae.1